MLITVKNQLIMGIRDDLINKRYIELSLIFLQQLRKAYKLKYMNQQIKSQEEDELYDHDSFFNIWQSGSNLKDSMAMGNNFLNNYNEFGGSAISQASFHFTNNVRSEKEVADFHINGNQFENISLTDLLKTNCSHYQLNNSIRNMAAFDKVTNQNFTNNQQTENVDGLQMVSNRKLQNRYNSKRSRERKKQQWQHLKETINQLQLENRTLRKSIEKQFQNKNYQNKKRYCKKCQNQIKDSSQDEDQSKNKISQGQTQLQYQKQKYNSKNNLQKQYLRVFLGKQQSQQKKYLKNKNQKQCLYEQQKDNDYKQFEKWVEGEGKNIWKKGKQYIQQKQRTRNLYQNRNNSKTKFDVQKQMPMQLQFQQVNFFNSKQVTNKPKKQKNINKDKKWMGKVWIALSVIMMVIGVQLHGLQGSGEKSIRISNYQANNWAQNFKNPNVDSLTIKMKTKLPITFIKNQKQIQNQSHFKWKQKWNLQNYQQYKSKPNKYKNNNQMQVQLQQRQNKFSQNKNIPQNWFERMNFETQEQYNRSMLNQQEQQAEIRIDKDLLFSIQAQFDDIGMYI